MKICVAGQGAFGQKHLDALKRISGVEVVSVVQVGSPMDGLVELCIGPPVARNHECAILPRTACRLMATPH